MSDHRYEWLETVNGQFIKWFNVERLSIEEIGIRWPNGCFWVPIFEPINLPNARQIIAHDGEARWCLGFCDDEDEAREYIRQTIEDCGPYTDAG